MKKLFFALLLLPLFQGCKIIKDIFEEGGPLTRTEVLINDAISKISAQSESWQVTLTELENKLIDDGQSTLSNEIQNLSSRTGAVIGTEFRCNADFLGDRVVQELRRIKARLLGKAVPDRKPALCQVIPTSIDMNISSERRNKIDITGYDFDNQPDLKLYLISGNQKIDVSSSLNRLTHYHMVVNLGSNGIILNQSSNKLIVEYDNKEFSSIPISQPQIPNCIIEEKEFSPGIMECTPTHTKGDKDFDGNGPKVEGNASIYIEGNTVKARLYMKAEETESDWTTAEGSKVSTIYTPPSNREILEIISDKFSEQKYTDSDHTDDYFDQGAGELIKRFIFIGDTGDDDAGTRTQTKVTFNPVRVKLREIGNCKN